MFKGYNLVLLGRPELSPYFSKHLRSLFESCWLADPPQRPEILDITSQVLDSYSPQFLAFYREILPLDTMDREGWISQLQLCASRQRFKTSSVPKLDNSEL